MADVIRAIAVTVAALITASAANAQTPAANRSSDASELKTASAIRRSPSPPSTARA